MSLVRKARKTVFALGHPLTRSALRHGVGPSLEHLDLLKGLAPLKTIVDVGANVGQFAVMCRHVFPEASIHSFEPVTASADRFERVLGHDPGVTLHRVALGAEPASARMHVTRRADSSSLLELDQQSRIFDGTQEVRTEAVQVVRLSDVVSTEQIAGPALLKVDVQGFEGEVLKGCEDKLPLFDWIYCEMSFLELYKGQPLAHELIPWLAERQFRLSGVETDPYLTHSGRSVQADFLFSNEGTGA